MREFLEREPLWELRMSWARLDKAGFFIEASLRREYFGDLPFWNLPAFAEGNPVALENDQLAKGLVWLSLDPLRSPRRAPRP